MLGFFVIDGILTNKQGEETRHIYVTRCEPQVRTVVILQVSTAPPVFPLTFCLGRVWLEAKRSLVRFGLKDVALCVGACHDFFNTAVKLLSETQYQTPCHGGSHWQAWNNLDGMHAACESVGYQV